MFCVCLQAKLITAAGKELESAKAVIALLSPVERHKPLATMFQGLLAPIQESFDKVKSLMDTDDADPEQIQFVAKQLKEMMKGPEYLSAKMESNALARVVGRPKAKGKAKAKAADTS